jgi:hypothetical protein
MAPLAPTYCGTAPTSPHNSGHNPATTQNFNSADISNIIYKEIDIGAVPPPLSNDWVIYVVLTPGIPTPTGTATADCGLTNGGCNYLDAHTVNGINVQFASAFVSSYNLGGNVTFGALLSHELTEAATYFATVTNCAGTGRALSDYVYPDSTGQVSFYFGAEQAFPTGTTLIFDSQPYALYTVQSDVAEGDATGTVYPAYTGSLGWTTYHLGQPDAPDGIIRPYQAHSLQISDLCQCLVENTAAGPNSIEGYWSAADGACVIPEHWGNLLYSPSPTTQSWPDSLHAPVQAYGGRGGVVMFGDNGVNGFFSPSSGWLGITPASGLRGAEYAVAGNWVVQVPLDTSQPPAAYGFDQNNQYNWYQLTGPQYPGIITSVVTAAGGGNNGNIAVTDANGHVWIWEYDWSPYQWADVTPSVFLPGLGYFQFPVDQLVADGTDLLATDFSRTMVMRYPGASFGTFSGAWGLDGTAQYPIVQLVASSDRNSNGPHYYSVTADYYGLYPGYADNQPYVMTFGQEYAVMQNTPNAWFMQSTYYPYQTAYVGYGLSNSNWVQAGGSVGRLVSGAWAFATSCSGGSAPCVVY